jgi:hypothetical protein
MVETDGFQKEITVLANNSTYQNKERRFHGYKVSAQLLKLKYRQKLPMCVEDYIKTKFPEANRLVSTTMRLTTAGVRYNSKHCRNVVTSFKGPLIPPVN